MPIQLKTDFETVEEAAAYIQGEVAAELQRLQAVEDDEKPALLRKRDELLKETKDAKQRAADLESQLEQATGKVSELESQVKGTAATEDELQKKYRTAYEQDKQSFQQQLDELKAEREREREQANQAQLRAAALGELGKSNYRLHNPNHFYALHGDKITRDPDTGELYVDMGDYKRQTISQYVQDIESRPDEQHLFKPKGGSGSGSPGSGSGSAGAPSTNPFKTGNLTEQMKLFKQNPALYERMKTEAGK